MSLSNLPDDYPTATRAMTDAEISAMTGMTDPPVPTGPDSAAAPPSGLPKALEAFERIVNVHDYEGYDEYLADVELARRALSGGDELRVDTAPQHSGLPKEPSEEAVEAFFAHLKRRHWTVQQPTSDRHVTSDLVDALRVAYRVDASSPRTPTEEAALRFGVEWASQRLWTANHPWQERTVANPTAPETVVPCERTEPVNPLAPEVYAAAMRAFRAQFGPQEETHP